MRIDQAAQSVGEGWVTGATSGDKSCTVREAALLLAVTDRRVRQLIHDGAIRSSGKARDGHVLLLADVLAYREQRDVLARRSAS
jgi:excisionase family DNA binding protein